MQIKNTKAFLQKLESLFAESDYILRYEKGNFKAGYCVLKDKKVIIINKYFTTEGKITCILELLNSTPIDTSNLTAKSIEIYNLVKQTKLFI